MSKSKLSKHCVVLAKRKYHIVYLILDTHMKMKYIGIHSTDDINDNYLGSGRAMLRAVSDYRKELRSKGLSNSRVRQHVAERFVKTVLHVYGTRDEAIDKEKELVDYDWAMSDLTYNRTVGGQSGKYIMTDEVKQRIAASHTGMKHSPETCRKISQSLQGLKKPVRDCPHCGKSVGVNMFARWHGDKCKQRNV